MKKEREDRMQKVFREAVEANPIIAAVKDEDGLKNCCENEEIGVVFCCSEIFVRSAVWWNGCIGRGRSRWCIWI